MSQRCSDHNTKVIRFYPWTVTIPYFSGANNWIEIDNFCALNGYINGNHDHKDLVETVQV